MADCIFCKIIAVRSRPKSSMRMISAWRLRHRAAGSQAFSGDPQGALRFRGGDHSRRTAASWPISLRSSPSWQLRRDLTDSVSSPTAVPLPDRLCTICTSTCSPASSWAVSTKMDRARVIASCAESEEDKVLLARVLERISQGDRGASLWPAVFLSPRSRH